MLYSTSMTSQVVSDFTTISSNTGCGSLVVEFQDLSTGSPDTWSWDFGNGNVSNLQNPIAVYTDPGIYTVKLTVSDLNSYDDKTMVDLIEVYHNPSSYFNQNLTEVCATSLIDFSDQSISNSNIINWMWDFGDGGNSNLEDPVYQYNDSGIYTVSLSIEDDKGCQDIIVMNDLIDVKSIPAADFTSDINISCDTNKIINFTNLSSNSNNYTWDFGDGYSSNQFSPSHNYVSGNYSITLISDNGICGDTITYNNFIEIGLNIIPSFTSNAVSTCIGEEIFFLDMTSNSPDSWFWNFGDGNVSSLQNPSHQYDSSGFYSVSLTTSINGECIFTKSEINYIEVFSSPLVSFSADSLYGCNIPFDVRFIDNTVDAVNWTWIFENGDSSNLQDPIISFNSYGVFDVILKVEDMNGCSSTNTSLDYIIIDQMELQFYVSDSIVCESDIVYFIDNSTSSFPITSYLWDFGDGQISNLKDPQHQYDSISTFDISLEIENSIGCTLDNFFPSLIKTVGPPTVDFFVNPLVSCAGQDIIFSDLTTSPDVISNWLWDFGDGGISTLQNPVHQYNNTGSYNISLIAGQGNCTDTIIKYNYIDIIEPVSFFISEFNCDDPLVVEFVNFSQGASSVLWDFGDGTTSTDFNPIHIFPSRGIYDVSLKVTNNNTGCNHEYIDQIRISIPIADFNYLLNSHNSYEDSIVCANAKRSYIDNLSQDCRNYRIDWGDGYVGYNRVDHLYSNPGIYDVSLMITGFHGCKDTLTINNMYRVADVIADFSVDNIAGCDSLIVEFKDLNSVNSDVIWEFGDGNFSNINDPIHIYSGEGIYDVTLYALSEDGCRDTITKEEYIHFVYPEIDFAISDTELCANTDVYLFDASNGINLEYLWDFGDGTTSNLKNPVYSYLNSGAFRLSLTITDTFGCSSIDSSYVIMVQEAIASFHTSITSSECPPLITTFTNQSTSNIINYLWDFGDGTTSSQISPSHLYSHSGDYDVQLIVEDNYGCKDTLLSIGLISINGPSGTFSISTNKICSLDSIHFTANTENSHSYLWDFGDGTFSTDSAPTHIYSGSNYYSPILILENNSICQVILEIEDSIQVIEIIVDLAESDSICFGDSLLISPNGNGDVYVWENSNFILDPIMQEVIVFPDSNMFFYVTNSDGMCLATDSIEVYVHHNIPSPSFVYYNKCYKDSMSFIGDAGILSTSFDWEWNILGENLFTQDISFVFDSIGEYTVELLVENLENNCKGSIIQSVEVLDLPTADFRTTQVCFGEKTNFFNLSSNDVVSSLWSFDDGFQSSFDFEPSCVYSSAGTYNPTLIVASENGCLNTISKPVLVYAIPEVNIDISSSCLGNENIFTSNTSVPDGFIDLFTWDFGDSSFLSDKSNTTHVYSNYGQYNVSLNVISNFGCTSTTSAIAHVYPNPEVYFLSEYKCIGDVTKFTDKTNLSEGMILSYYWDFGDGSTSILRNPSYQYNSIGSYQTYLEVISSDNCSSSIEKTVIIHDLPDVDFVVDRDVCEDEEIAFYDQSLDKGEIIKWEWAFGDRNQSNLQNPNHIYLHPGIYDINLSVESEFGCLNSLFKEDFINVNSIPIASFDMTETKVSLLDPTIIFTNTSDSSLYFEWNFDNGEFNSSEITVEVSFDYADIYDISLYVENETGCYDEVIHAIEVDQNFTIFIPNSFTPNGDGLNDYFDPQLVGYHDFEIKIYDRWGSLVYFSKDANDGWDGSHYTNNDLLENGTYMYNIYVLDYNNKPWLYNGEINLMR